MSEPCELDRAWQEAEAALPEERLLMVRQINRTGWWTASARRYDGRPVAAADGDTPAAALRALAARLRPPDPA